LKYAQVGKDLAHGRVVILRTPDRCLIEKVFESVRLCHGLSGQVAVVLNHTVVSDLLGLRQLVLIAFQLVHIR
jgi:hypothetical protein